MTHIPQMTWNIDKQIAAARGIELDALLCELHVAIGGSCVMRGYSPNDADFFIYQHKSTVPPNFERFFGLLVDHGYSDWEWRDHSKYGDEKVVWTARYKGHRADFIFLCPTPTPLVIHQWLIQHGLTQANQQTLPS